MAWERFMKLEAVDQFYPTLFGVATVVNISGDKVKLAFDGYSQVQDYETQKDSEDLHPLGYCRDNGFNLRPPKGFEEGFDWGEYLHLTKTRPLPFHCFSEKQRGDTREDKELYESVKSGGDVIKEDDPVPLKDEGKEWASGQYLEVNDPKHPNLICVGLISQVEGPKLQIHLYGDESTESVEMDKDDPRLHPAGYSAHIRSQLHPLKGKEFYFDWAELAPHMAALAFFSDEQREGADHPAAAPKSAGKEDYWKPNMKLEAMDVFHNIWGVATIASVAAEEQNGTHVKITFDKWESIGVEGAKEGEIEPISMPISALYLRPIGFAHSIGMALRPPKGYAKPFSWAEYLKESGAATVPLLGFTKAQLGGYKPWPAMHRGAVAATEENKSSDTPPPRPASKTNKSSACTLM